MESPYSQHLHTNYVPSGIDASIIQELLKPRDAQISQLDKAISSLQLVLTALMVEREGLYDDTKAHRSLISPMRRLPPELLKEIFICCLPSNRNAIMNVRDAPLVLGRVCSLWRQISLTTPRLWSSLHIPLLPSSYDSFPGPDAVLQMMTPEPPDPRREIVAEWLQRAGRCDISLSLRAQTSRAFETVTSLVEMIQAVVSTSAQWRSLDLFATQSIQPFSHATHLWNSMDPQKDLPRLEFLKIEISTMRPSNLFAGFWKDCALLRAPRLRQLDISTVYPLELPVRWRQLTRFSLNVQSVFGGMGLSYCSVLSVLKACHELVTLKVRLKDPAQPNPTPSIHPEPEILLPNLKYLLVVMPLQGAAGCRFLSRLELPALLHLEYTSDSRYLLHDIQYALASAGVKQCGPSLQILRINVGTFHRSVFIDVLRSMPALIQLEIVRSINSNRSIKQIQIPIDIEGVDDHVLELLTPFHPDTADQESLCPQLQYFRWEINTPFSDSALIRFIRMKRFSPQSKAKLKQIQVSFDRPQEIDVISEVSDVIKEGLNLTFTYSRGSNIKGWDGLQHAERILQFGWPNAPCQPLRS